MILDIINLKRIKVQLTKDKNVEINTIGDTFLS